MKSARKHRTGSTRPIVRLRSMLLGAVGTAFLISGPLLMVWKQVYLTSTSVQINKMTDSLAVLSREIASLRLRCERLSSKERIEAISQRSLGLDYTSADNIVIVKVPELSGKNRIAAIREMTAFFRRPFQRSGGS